MSSGAAANLCVAVPYLASTVVYIVADGHARGPLGSLLARFGHDLLVGGAKYQLYFLLVSMQIYLCFPVIRWLIWVTDGHHRLLLGACAAFHPRRDHGAGEWRLPAGGGAGEPGGGMDVLPGGEPRRRAAVEHPQPLDLGGRRRLLSAGVTGPARWGCRCAATPPCASSGSASWRAGGSTNPTGTPPSPPPSRPSGTSPGGGPVRVAAVASVAGMRRLPVENASVTTLAIPTSAASGWWGRRAS